MEFDIILIRFLSIFWDKLFWDKSFTIGVTRTSAHPRFEGELEIFATPNIKPAVVRAETFKESSIYREKASSHRWWPHRLRWILVPLLLPLRNSVPIELIQKSTRNLGNRANWWREIVKSWKEQIVSKCFEYLEKMVNFNFKREIKL